MGLSKWITSICTGHCSLRLVLAVEQLMVNKKKYEVWSTRIPVNALRNIALQNARTEVGLVSEMTTPVARYTCPTPFQFVMLLDGDFVPGPPTLHAHLRDSVLPGLRDEMKNIGTLLVLPALDCKVPWEQGADGLPVFPSSQHSAVIRRMFTHSNTTKEATSKAAVVEALATGVVEPFHLCCHRETNYNRWLHAQSPYKVKGYKWVRFACLCSIALRTHIMCTV